tara:strand:- start:81 stop:254 length:174 start_codon:yes stop_codon:yes gene_type:complete
MINIFNFFNKALENTLDNKHNANEDLVKYFKSEYGSSWKLELDKYLIKEENNVKKVA